jgi:hypothetical protein
MNNMGREIMAALKRFQVGSDGDGVTVGGALVVSGSTTANTLSATNVTASGTITTAAGTASAPAIVPTGDTNTGIFFPAADTIAFAEGGAEAMRITSDGNVGIGNNNPATVDGNTNTKLTVGDSTTDFGALGVITAVRKASVGNSAVGSFQFANTNLVTTDKRLATIDGRTGTNTNDGVIAFNTASAGTLAERMRINADGSTQFTNSSVGNSAYIRAGDSVTVASGATLTLTNDIAGAALICVYQTANGLGGVFFTNFSIAVAKISGDGEATDTGSTFALYKSSSSHTTTFKNKEGVTRAYRFGVYSANANL